MSTATNQATWEDFQKIEIRVGSIVEAVDFPDGRSSTHILTIDLGPTVGLRKSLARLSPLYPAAELTGRQVLCVVNFPPRQIGPHRSEVLTLGLPDAEGNVVLLTPERPVPVGGRVY